MPRLLVVSTVRNMMEAFLLPFAAHFRRNGWTVDALANRVSQSRACAASFERLWDIEWSRNPLSPANFSRSVRRVREVCAEGNYDIVHVHTPVASLLTRYALRSWRQERRLRVIYTAHGFHFYEGGPLLRNAVYRRVERLAARWTDYLVVINRMDYRAALSAELLPAARIVYMPGIGLDTRGRYSPSSVAPDHVDRVRRDLGLQSGDRLILMIAEFNPGKRHADALTALARVKEFVHLALAGEGPLRESIARMAHSLGLQRRVHFLGVRDDIPALVRASAATLLTSAREGLPRSIMESMSLGVPVIATDIRGNRDLLEGGAGVLVPVGNVDAIARAITWVTERSEEADQMAGIALERAPNYDIHRILQLHEDLYARALNTEAVQAVS